MKDENIDGDNTDPVGYWLQSGNGWRYSDDTERILSNGRSDCNVFGRLWCWWLGNACDFGLYHYR